MDFEIDRDVELPPDFIDFVRRNYERIEEIEKKVEEFQNSWKNTSNFKYLFNLRFQKVFDSVDSCFSEGDIKKVISAKITPRLTRLNDSDSDDEIDFIGKFLSNSANNQHQITLVDDPDTEYLQSVKKNHPLVHFDHSRYKNRDIDKNEPGPTPKQIMDRVDLQIEGVHLSMAERSGGKLITDTPPETENRGNLSKIFHTPVTTIRKRVTFQRQRKVVEDGEIETNHSRDCNLGNLQNNYNIDSQLALPPLHSSVLALLGGQKSKSRGPGGVESIQQPHPTSTDLSSSGATKHKKLRRHGRTRKNDGDRQTENRAGSEEVKKVDDPKDTQISTIGENKTEEEQAAQLDKDPALDDLKQNLTIFKHSRKALYTVLDDYLAGKMWSAQDMTTLENQIDSISQEFQKLETKFQTQSIQLKESTWLNFPRTWSHSSATFAAPNNSKALKDMKPLDYLKKFVTVSGPRKHLYSLVFQRYRTMENPTKDWIWIKTLQPALSEVLGRSFSTEEMLQLCQTYLGAEMEQEISELTFIGICAFCERMYAEYSLEENDECHRCYKEPNSYQHECHQNKRNHLEKADMAYLFTKLSDGLVQKNLSNMFLALCNKE